MAKIQVSVDVTKEAYELGQGLVQFSSHLRAALLDGWQPGKDLPVVLSAALADLVPAFQGVEALGVESKESEEAFVTAFLLSGKQLVYVFKKP